MQGYHEDIKSHGSLYNTTVSDLEEHLRTLSAKVATEHDLNKQIGDHLVEKTRLDGKLSDTIGNLQLARQQVASASDRERELLQQVASLQAEATALREKSADSAATVARLMEIESKNNAIQEQLRSLQDTTMETSSKLWQSFDDHAKRQQDAQEIESLLMEERSKALSVATERIEEGRKASRKLEETMAELSHKAKWDNGLLNAEHRLAREDLKRQLDVANEDCVKLAKEQSSWSAATVEQIKSIAEMRGAKEIAERTASQHLRTIEILTKERNDAHIEASNCAAELKELHSEKRKEVRSENC